MKYKLLLAFIFLFGLFIRTFHVETNPVSIYWDEASIGYEAFSVAQTGKDMHGNSWLQAIFPAYGDYKAPVYIWFTSIFIKILGPTVLAIRFTSVLFGSLTIISIYYLAKLIFKDEKIGLLSALLLSLLPGHIQFSRSGFESNLAVFFISLFLIFLYKATSNRKFIYLSSIPAIISTYTYFSARIIIPFIFILWFITNIKSIKKFIIPSLVFAGIFIISMVPLFKSPYYQASNQIRLSTDSVLDNDHQIIYANQLRAEDGNTLISRLIHHRYTYMLKEFFINFTDHLNPDYLFFTGDPNPRHSTGFSGVMLPISLAIFILGLTSLTKHKKETLFILGLWFIVLIPASVPQTTPHLLRSLSSVIPISIILALGANQLIQISKKSKSYKIVTSLLAVLFFINFLFYYYHLQTIYNTESSFYWQDGYPQLGEYLQKNYPDYDYFFINPGDRLFLYTLFYGAFDPTIIQQQQLENLAKNPNHFSIEKYDKVTFKPLIAEDISSYPTRSLVIGAPDSVLANYKIKDEIKNSNQQTVFVSIDMGDQ